MADANEEKIKREMDEVLHGRSKAAQGPAGFKQNEYTKIHHVIGVISGKGGVGKSFVCGSLAVELARSGARVGILDADITGPSIPKMLGLAGERATAVNDILEQARQEARDAFDPSRIGAVCGSDIDGSAIALCKRHIQQAGLGGRITVTQKDLRDLQLDTPAPLFLLNPPYGERLSDRKECEKLYRDLRRLKDRHPDCRMGVITAHTGFERCFGLRAGQKRRLYNGRLECEFLLY